MSGNLGNTKTSKWSPAQIAKMQGLTVDELNAKTKEENRKKYLAKFAGIDGSVWCSSSTILIRIIFFHGFTGNSINGFRI